MVTPLGDNELSESYSAFILPRRRFPLISDQGLTLSLIFILTNPFQCYVSLSNWWCVFCLFTPYLSIIFAFRENLSLTESNQQIYHFYKSVTIEKQRRCGTRQSNFLLPNYSFNVIQRTAVSTLTLAICTYMAVSVYWLLCVPCVLISICVISNQSTSKKLVIF